MRDAAAQSEEGPGRDWTSNIGDQSHVSDTGLQSLQGTTTDCLIEVFNTTFALSSVSILRPWKLLSNKRGGVSSTMNNLTPLDGRQGTCRL